LFVTHVGLQFIHPDIVPALRPLAFKYDLARLISGGVSYNLDAVGTLNAFAYFNY
jgi:hypothetical protein